MSELWFWAMRWQFIGLAMWARMYKWTMCMAKKMDMDKWIELSKERWVTKSIVVISEEMVKSCCCHINLLFPCDVVEDHDVGTLSHGDLLTNGRAGAGALSCLPELRLRLLHNRFPTRSSSVAKFIRSFFTSEVREKNGNLSTSEYDFYVANKDYTIIVYGGMDNTMIESCGM